MEPSVPIENRSKLLSFLFFIRLGAVASYSVMFSTLSLYLVDRFGLSKALASDIVGIFVAFVYILPLIGGAIGQRLLPYRTLFILGVSLQVIGALILAYDELQLVYWGLPFFLMGSMVGSLCINMLITQSYSKEEVVERKAAFLWNYSGMNFGFLIGYLISGIFQLNTHYATLFLWVAAFSGMAILLMLLASKVVLAKVENRVPSIKNLAISFGIMIALIYAIHFILEKAYLSKVILLDCSAVLFIGFFIYLYLFNQDSRRAIAVFFTFAVLSMIFWSIYMLTPTSLMLFIQDYVKISYGNVHIPPQWLDIVDAGVLVLFTPVLASMIKIMKNKRNYILTTARSFQFGFLVYLLGIIILLIAMHMLNAPINIVWIAIYMTIQAVAEAFIGPSGYALIGDILSEKMRGIATGLWMMTLGIAGLIASGISNIAFSQIITQKYSGIVSFQHTFTFILILGAIAMLAVSAMQNFLTSKIIVSQ
jgi:POT family proton-dependent oligopeptide transporter